MATFGFVVITFMIRYVHAPCVVINRPRSLIIVGNCIHVITYANFPHCAAPLPPSSDFAVSESLVIGCIGGYFALSTLVSLFMAFNY